MSWNYQRSVERIQEHLGDLGKITVEKLKKEADLFNLLSETNCREIFGSHVYVPVSNFAALTSTATGSDEIKRLIQSVHVYQREVSRIVEDLFDGFRVHFQGSRLHALFYRPIDDEAEISARAVLLQMVLRDFVSSVFNPAFPVSEDYVISGGCDIGNVIGTQDGVRGDRELLFVGGAANHAAHSIGSPRRFHLTQQIYDSLYDDLQALCVLVPDSEPPIYQIDKISSADLKMLCAGSDIDWDPEKSRKRVEDDRKQFPLTEISYGSAEVLIDIETLGIKNNKRVLAGTIFADLCGFTAYVDSAATDDEKEAALRVMHAVRKEFARVLTLDFDGVRIQYQGDNVQAIFHLPEDDEKAIAKKSFKAAAALQSSMETTLKDCLPAAKDLHLAVGIDVGTTLVSKLGSRGARDRICIGEAVETAARIEQVLGDDEIGTSKHTYDALPVELQELFVEDPARDCYVAKGIRAEKLERLEGAEKYSSGRPVFVNRTAAGTAVSAVQVAGARQVTPSRTYSS
jgi:class 3 adenylate cyclase